MSPVRHRSISMPSRSTLRPVKGLTLVELMVSMTLSMFVVLAATVVLFSSKAGYLTVDDGTRLQESGRYAMELISRNIRQTAFENWDKDDAPIVLADSITASIAGLDNKTTDETQAFISPASNGAAGAKNDVLGLKFYGSGAGTSGDGTVLNCAGFGVSAPSSAASADTDRGASVFYVARSSRGDMELRCKYASDSGWNSEAIISGVDSFQVLYGLDTTGNGIPSKYVSASTINYLDQIQFFKIPYTIKSSEARNAEKNKITNWKKVVAIKIALLISGSQKGRVDQQTAVYDLFGEKYSAENAASDPGTQVREENLPADSRNRLRQLFTATILIRNRSAN